MANETQKDFNEKEENLKLTQIYKSLVDGTYVATPEAQRSLMMQLLNTKITQIEAKTRYKKYIHYTLRIGILVLSSISSIVLGLKLDHCNWVKIASNTALILTSMVTFLSSLAIFWDIETYWIRLKIMLNKLKRLRYEYTFEAVEGGKLSDKEIIPYLEKFIAIQSDEYWENYFDSIKKD